MNYPETLWKHKPNADTVNTSRATWPVYLFLQRPSERPVTGYQKWCKLAFGEHICCFSVSEKPSYTLSWSHYANNHNGICIGLDTKSLLDDARFPKALALPKVSYKGNRVVYNGSEQNTLDLLTTKSQIWCYESEWRILASTDDADDVVFADQTNLPPLYFFKFSEVAVSKIILGSSLNLRTYNGFCKAVDAANARRSELSLPKISIQQAKIHPI